MMHPLPQSSDEVRFVQRIAERLDRDRPRTVRPWGVNDALRQSVAELHHLQERCRTLHAFTRWDRDQGAVPYAPAVAELFQDASRTVHASRSNLPAASLQQRLARQRHAISFAAAEEFCDDARRQVAAGYWGLIERGPDGAAQVCFRGRLQPQVSARDLLAEIESGRLYPSGSESPSRDQDPSRNDADEEFVPTRVYDFTAARETPLSRELLFRWTHRDAAELFDRFVPSLRNELRLVRGAYLEPGSFLEIPGYCITLGPYVLALESESRRYPTSIPRRVFQVAILGLAMVGSVQIMQHVTSQPPTPPAESGSTNSLATQLVKPPAAPTEASNIELEANLLRQLWEHAPREK